MADFVSLDNQWKWEIFSPNHIVLKIASIQPPTPTRGQDPISWSASSKGLFTIKSAYHHLAGLEYEDKESNWLLAWLWKGPQDICIFIWTVMHDRLKTKLELRRRHLDSDGICDRCGLDLESPLHVIRDCPVAKRICNYFIPKSSQADFFSMSLKDWLFFNIRSKEQTRRNVD